MKLKPMFKKNNYPVNAKWYAAALAGGVKTANKKIQEEAAFLEKHFNSTAWKAGLDPLGGKGPDNFTGMAITVTSGLIDAATIPAILMSSGLFFPPAAPFIMFGATAYQFMAMWANGERGDGNRYILPTPGIAAKMAIAAPLAAISTFDAKTEYLIFQHKYFKEATSRFALGTVADVVRVSEAGDQNIVKYDTTNVFENLKGPSGKEMTNDPLKSQKIIESIEAFHASFIKVGAPNAASTITEKSFPAFLNTLESEVWEDKIKHIAYIDQTCPEVGPETTPYIWEKVKAERVRLGLEKSEN